MKIINISLSFLLAVTASAAKEHHIVKDLDGFAEQTEVAKAKHIVSSESQLRGNTAPPPTPGRRPRNRNNRRRRNDWLDYHNQYREEWHVKEGYTYVPLEWSNDLFIDALDHAKKLTAECKVKTPEGDLNNYGWNIAGKQGHSEFRTVEDVFNVWNNHLYQGWPNNKEMSQVLWRSTEFVGCADSSTDSDAEKKCTFSVCFYARAGNCGMGSIQNWNDHSEKIMTSPACGPCPGDAPDCA